MRSPAALIRHGVHNLPACREEFCVQDLLGGIRAVAREVFHLEPRLIRRERERPGVGPPEENGKLRIQAWAVAQHETQLAPLCPDTRSPRPRSSARLVAPFEQMREQHLEPAL